VTEKVLSGAAETAARVLTTEESMPPLRNAPTGTSDTKMLTHGGRDERAELLLGRRLRAQWLSWQQVQYGRRRRPRGPRTRSSPGATRCTSR